MQPGWTRILFVCIGNICRSPTAEVVFRTVAERRGLANRVLVDSAGTGEWHVGNPPDYRAVAHASRRAYDLSPLRARQVTIDDFSRFDLILAMEQSVLDELEALRPADFGGQLGRFLDVVPDLAGRDVPDPYDGDGADFEVVLDLIERGSEALAERLLRQP